MLVLLLVAALQAQSPDRNAPASDDRHAPPADQGSSSGSARDRAGRPVDDRFATDPNAPPRPTRRVTVPNPHDPEPATSNPHR